MLLRHLAHYDVIVEDHWIISPSHTHMHDACNLHGAAHALIFL
jgi:hypothetical protein